MIAWNDYSDISPLIEYQLFEHTNGEINQFWAKISIVQSGNTYAISAVKQTCPEVRAFESGHDPTILFSILLPFAKNCISI